MSFSENGNGKHDLPTIVLGRYVSGCNLSNVKGKYAVKRPDGDLSCRVDGIDFDINACLRQNTGPLRIALKSILAGVTPDGTEINTALLNDVIQKRVHMLLQAHCKIIKKESKKEETCEGDISLRAPLVTNIREKGIWNKVDLADEMGFDLIRGDKLILKIRSIDFTDAKSSLALGLPEHVRPKNN